LKLYREKIAVVLRKKNINTLCGHNVDLMNAIPAGASNK